MLGENIKAARKSKGLTQDEIAGRLNVVRQTVSKWEKNLSVPDADMLERLSDILGVEIRMLLGCDPVPNDKISENAELKLICDQPAKINEREAMRIRRIRRIWKAVGIACVSVIIVLVIWYLFGKTISVNESVTDVIKKGMDI